MAQKIIYTCDICGKEMPEEGIILTVEDSDTHDCKTWDICDACNHRLVETIASMQEE